MERLGRIVPVVIVFVVPIHRVLSEELDAIFHGCVIAFPSEVLAAKEALRRHGKSRRRLARAIKKLGFILTVDRIDKALEGLPSGGLNLQSGNSTTLEAEDEPPGDGQVGLCSGDISPATFG